jgi:choline dehydrogenase-like flavoprotein
MKIVNLIFSSAHHSGTARISQSPENGVCDMNLKVHAFSNVYICDGSAIPASGYSNTGLTIAALAVRLADHLKGRYGFE